MRICSHFRTTSTYTNLTAKILTYYHWKIQLTIPQTILGNRTLRDNRQIIAKALFKRLLIRRLWRIKRIRNPQQIREACPETAGCLTQIYQKHQEIPETETWENPILTCSHRGKTFLSWTKVKKHNKYSKSKLKWYKMLKTFRITKKACEHRWQNRICL